MLNQFPRDSWHVNRLPSKNVPNFVEEFDEREFLFGVQTVAYVSHLRRFLRRQRAILLSVSSGWMDVLEVLTLVLTGSGGVGLGQGLLQLLELCRCHQSISSLTALSVTVKSPLDISP
jgi:hypothetical protein